MFADVSVTSEYPSDEQYEYEDDEELQLTATADDSEEPDEDVPAAAADDDDDGATNGGGDVKPKRSVRAAAALASGVKRKAEATKAGKTSKVRVLRSTLKVRVLRSTSKVRVLRSTSTTINHFSATVDSAFGLPIVSLHDFCASDPNETQPGHIRL